MVRQGGFVIRLFFAKVNREFRPSPEKNTGHYFFWAEKCAREFRPRGLENGGNRAKTEACFYDINVTKAGFFAAVGQLKYNRGRRGGGGVRRGLIRRRNMAQDKTGVNLCWRGKHRVNVDKRLNCAFLRIKLWKTLKKFCGASHGFSIRFDKKEPPFLGENVFSKAVLTNPGGGGYHIDKDTENVSKNVTRIGGIVYVWRKKFALAKKIRFGEKNSLFAKPCVVCVEKSLH